ncbi:hypothetical protein [Halomicrococcus sp. SG-WS-1]|uniref:hypothetical protein n=1 Tax=Halomicrococcus sp. SG-WS-1 TaxID=3439057 RepID=UPI003F7A5FC5
MNQNVSPYIGPDILDRFERFGISTHDIPPGLLDITGEEVQLNDGESVKFSVDSRRATHVLTFIDGGQVDEPPAEYTLTQRLKTDAASFTQRMFYSEVTNTQQRSFRDPAIPPNWEVEIENTSGEDSEVYRILLVSVNMTGQFLQGGE